MKRPPLYYFEEVEEKRARERELLASWYQPIPEPESPIATKPLTPPTTASKPPVETTVVSAVAAGVRSGYRRQRRRGGNNLVHCRIRCGYAIVQPGVQRPTGSGERGHRSKTTAAQSRACSYASGTGLLRHQATVAAGAEQRARQAERDPHYDDELLSDEEADAMEQDELARQFAATQQQRCHRAERHPLTLNRGKGRRQQDHAFPARNTRQQHIMLGRLFHIRRGIASPVENAARVVKETRITLAFKPEQRPMIERA